MKVTISQLASDAGLEGPRRYKVDWGRAEAELGTSLPSDYKEYVYWFGPGGFEEYLYICIPGVENSVTELGSRLKDEGKISDLRKKINPDSPRPYSLFPEVGGWLPWGFTIDGDALYWVTSPGDPNAWTVAASSRADDLAHFNGGFSQYLYSYIWNTGEMEFFDETDSQIPIPFEASDGKWRGGGERLSEYGYFE